VFGERVIAIARCGECDEVMFSVETDPFRFVSVHLTWRGVPEQPPRPRMLYLNLQLHEVSPRPLGPAPPLDEDAVRPSCDVVTNRSLESMDSEWPTLLSWRQWVSTNPKATVYGIAERAAALLQSSRYRVALRRDG
jgi:hypothetical protein